MAIDWSRIRLLIIDMDNTLCDTFHTLSGRQWEHVAQAFAKRGRHDIAKGLLRRFGRESFAGTLGELGLTAEERRFAVRKYDENPVGTLRLFPDAKALLAVPQGKVLLSRGEPSLQRRKIRHLGIRRHFKEVVIVDTFEDKRRAIAAIVERHGIKPREALIIGDRIEEEIAAGRRLGIPTVLVRRPNWPVKRSRVKPDLSVRGLKALAKALVRAGALADRGF